MATLIKFTLTASSRGNFRRGAIVTLQPDDPRVADFRKDPAWSENKIRAIDPPEPKRAPPPPAGELVNRGYRLYRLLSQRLGDVANAVAVASEEDRQAYARIVWEQREQFMELLERAVPKPLGFDELVAEAEGAGPPITGDVDGGGEVPPAPVDDGAAPPVAPEAPPDGSSGGPADTAPAGSSGAPAPGPDSAPPGEPVDPRAALLSLLGVAQQDPDKVTVAQLVEAAEAAMPGVRIPSQTKRSKAALIDLLLELGNKPGPEELTS